MIYLLYKKDWIGIQETHSTEGTIAAWHPPKNTLTFWSHGTHQEKGIGLIINKTFLGKFDALTPESWKEIVKGRIALLQPRIWTF